MEPDEVARSAGLNKPSYFDVEAYDDEVSGNISLRALKAIARTLGTTAVKLLEGPDTADASCHRSAAAVVDLVRARISAECGTIDAYSERVGWDMNPTLANPDHLWDYPFDMLRELCDDLAIDWREVLASDVG